MVSIDIWFKSLAPKESDTNLDISPGNVWVPSGNKSLPEPMVTQVRVTIPDRSELMASQWLHITHPWINGWRYQDKREYEYMC